jgi:hypothetical protein
MIGVPQLLAIPVILLSGAIPLVAFILIIMMYIKINRIEKILKDKSNRQQN